MAKQVQEITINPINIKVATIHIEGTGTLVLNRMNARNTRSLVGERSEAGSKKVREEPNLWEDLATSIHWQIPLSQEPFCIIDTYREMDEQKMLQLLNKNKPCISAFGLKKSWCQAVVRNEIDKYGTKFDNAVNIVAINNLIPISFSSWSYEERLMSPKRGAPVLVRLNQFSGWSADIPISYCDHVYSLSTIVNVIRMAGFGIGIGSGRTSGYGRYEVPTIEA